MTTPRSATEMMAIETLQCRSLQPRKRRPFSKLLAGAPPPHRRQVVRLRRGLGGWQQRLSSGVEDQGSDCSFSFILEVPFAIIQDNVLISFIFVVLTVILPTALIYAAQGLSGPLPRSKKKRVIFLFAHSDQTLCPPWEKASS
jgi:hypothetical protein